MARSFTMKAATTSAGEPITPVLLDNQVTKRKAEDIKPTVFPGLPIISFKVAIDSRFRLSFGHWLRQPKLYSTIN